MRKKNEELNTSGLIVLGDIHMDFNDKFSCTALGQAIFLRYGFLLSDLDIITDGKRHIIGGNAKIYARKESVLPFVARDKMEQWLSQFSYIQFRRA